MMFSGFSGDVQRLWRRRFPNYDETEGVVRSLPVEAKERCRVIFHPSSLRPAEVEAGGLGCPLDAIAAEVSLPFRDWIVTPNPFPVARDHIVLLRREHRAEFEADDFLDGFAFASETGYRLLLNLRRSGASIPDHLHFQGLRADFPVFRAEHVGEPIVDEDGLRANLLRRPWGGFRLEPRCARARNRIARALVAWREPFNLVLTSDETYFFPRIRECSSIFPTFKFGAAEVAGIFYTQTRAMQESVDESRFLEAMNEVVMQEDQRAVHTGRLTRQLLSNR